MLMYTSCNYCYSVHLFHFHNWLCSVKTIMNFLKYAVHHGSNTHVTKQTNRRLAIANDGLFQVNQNWMTG